MERSLIHKVSDLTDCFASKKSFIDLAQLKSSSLDSTTTYWFWPGKYGRSKYLKKDGKKSKTLSILLGWGSITVAVPPGYSDGSPSTQQAIESANNLRHRKQSKHLVLCTRFLHLSTGGRRVLVAMEWPYMKEIKVSISATSRIKCLRLPRSIFQSRWLRKLARFSGGELQPYSARMVWILQSMRGMKKASLSEAKSVYEILLLRQQYLSSLLVWITDRLPLLKAKTVETSPSRSSNFRFAYLQSLCSKEKVSDSNKLRHDHGDSRSY